MNIPFRVRLSLLFLVPATFALVACETTPAPADTAPEAGRVDRALYVAGNETSQALNVAGNKTNQALNVAGRETGRAFGIAGREVNNASAEAGQFLEKLGKNLSDGSFW